MIEYVGSRRDAADIAACANTILSSVKGTIPFLRDMGLPDDIIGNSPADAEGAYIDAAIEQIEAWDERVVVGEIACQIQGRTIDAKVVLMDGE